jgi:hypothetical protein
MPLTKFSQWREGSGVWTTRFFGWSSAWWGFFSSFSCFAASAADEVRAAVEGFDAGGRSAARLA